MALNRVSLVINDLTEEMRIIPSLVPHHGGHPPLEQETGAISDTRDLLQTTPLPLFSEVVSGGLDGVGWVMGTLEAPQEVFKCYLCYGFCVLIVRGVEK